MRWLAAVVLAVSVAASCSPGDRPVSERTRRQFVDDCVARSDLDADVMRTACRCLIDTVSGGRTFGEVEDIQRRVREGEPIPPDVDDALAACADRATGGRVSPARGGGRR